MSKDHSAQKNIAQNLATFETELLVLDGRFYLVGRGVEVEITRHQAQTIYVYGPDFIIALDCHELDERIFGKKLAERMHQAFEERQRADFHAGVQAALALLKDQPGWYQSKA